MPPAPESSHPDFDEVRRKADEFARTAYADAFAQFERLRRGLEGNVPMDLATVDKLLTTTRTVRKRLDFTRPVDPEIIQTCLELAIQAPTGGNIPRYHFMVVTDAAKRTALAVLYKRAYFEVYSPQRQAEVSQSDPRLIDSATYLAEHMHDVPVLIIPCVEAPPVQGTGPGAYARCPFHKFATSNAAERL